MVVAMAAKKLKKKKKKKAARKEPEQLPAEFRRDEMRDRYFVVDRLKVLIEKVEPLGSVAHRRASLAKMMEAGGYGGR